MKTSVKLEGVSGGSQMGWVEIKSYSQPERTRRAMKILGMGWGCAVLAVLIPLLHFILVPSLLLAAPIAAVVVYGKESAILGGESNCPKCQAPFKISASPNKWPLKDVCSKCFENVTIQKSEGA